MQVVARDVKIQMDFNPDIVRNYRLIGYENRDVAELKELITHAIGLLKNKPQPIPQPIPLDDLPTASDLEPADIQFQQKP